MLFPRPRGRRARLLLALLLVAAALAAATALPIQGWLTQLQSSLQAAGPLGMAAFVGIFAAATMALVPAGPLALAAGLIYGGWGLLLTWGTMMAVSAVTFQLGRTVLAGPVERTVADQRLLRTVADVIVEEGWRMVLLVRVSGVVPFGMQNYVFGATRVPFAGFMLATSIGVLPSILLYGGAGVFGGAAAEGSAPGPLRAGVFGLGALAALTLVILTTRKVRARLARAAAPVSPAANA